MDRQDNRTLNLSASLKIQIISYLVVSRLYIHMVVDALATDVAPPPISENMLVICFLLVVVLTLEDFKNQ